MTTKSYRINRNITKLFVYRSKYKFRRNPPFPFLNFETILATWRVMQQNTNVNNVNKTGSKWTDVRYQIRQKSLTSVKSRQNSSVCTKNHGERIQNAINTVTPDIFRDEMAARITWKIHPPVSDIGTMRPGAITKLRQYR